VADSQAGLRNEPLDERGDGLYGFNAIVYKEDLSAAPKLKLYGALDDGF
jgi:hypothetical protein